MSLIADLIRAGVAPELVERVAEQMAEERARGAAESAPKRSKAADRQARYRERKASQTVTNHNNVTEVTKNVTDVTPGTEPRARVVNTTLPSEEISNIPPLVPPSAETASRKASRAKPRTAVAPDAGPNERNRADALASGLSGRAAWDEWQAFIDFHTAKGNVMASWDAAWRTWLRRRPKFGGGARASPEPQLSKLSRMAMGDFRGTIFDTTDNESTDAADESRGRSSGDVSERARANGGGSVVDLRPTGSGWR